MDSINLICPLLWPMRVWFRSCNWFPAGLSVIFLFPGSLYVQFQEMAACHQSRHDWTGKKISTGDTAAPLARPFVCNGLHSQALHERFYMATPKANWPMEIRLIVSSAWLPATMAAIWVPNHHRAPHLTKQKSTFLNLPPSKKKKYLILLTFPLLAPHPFVHLRISYWRLYNSSRITVWKDIISNTPIYRRPKSIIKWHPRLAATYLCSL